MSKDQTLPDTPSVTSLPESGDGHSLSNSPVGLQLGMFGREAVPANHSAPQGREGENPTNDTSGRSSDASSRSVALTWSLANKLRVSLEGRGAPEYVLTWREIPMRWGSSIYQLRASGQPTADSGSTGWPTPTGQDNPQVAGQYATNGTTLGGAAQQAGWASPTRDHKDSSSDGTVPENGLLGRQVWGWNSSRATDGSNGGPNQSGGALSNDAAGWPTPLGQTQSGSPSETGSKGVLNAALPLWLQGFPSDWLMAAPTKRRRGRKRSEG
jgi:hypothetical protein